MKTDYIDIMQLHNPSAEQVEQGDCVAVLQEMKQQGKVRWIGISSTHPFLQQYIDMGLFDVFQIPYSALERQHEAAIQSAADSGAGVIVRGGVARGEPGLGLGDKDRWAAWDKAKMDELLEAGENRTQFLCRFTISHPGMRTTIVGTKNPDHLRENIEAAQKLLYYRASLDNAARRGEYKPEMEKQAN